jgi:parallel beta-helix repeat protein
MHSNTNPSRSDLRTPLSINPLAAKRLIRRLALWAALFLAPTPFSPEDARAQIIKSVCPQGCDYPTISAAVNDIPLGPGVTIQVQPGIYRERIDIPAANSGSTQSRALIQATPPGSVTIEGSTPLTWTSCNPYNGIYHATVALTGTLDETRVSVDTVLYFYDTSDPSQSTTCSTQIAEGKYRYDAAAQTIYVHFPSGVLPGSHTYVSQNKYGFNISAHDITIDGFVVNHAWDAGILVLGASTADRVGSVVVSNCTAAYNKRHGILLQFTSNCSVLANRTYNNERHGVCLRASDHAYVAYNESFRNDDTRPAQCRGGVVGFKIGDGDTLPDVAQPRNDPVTDTNVEYNSAHNNEDSGFEVKGAYRILVRRNISYRNQDHGFDTNRTNRVVYQNNVATRNDHDGVSVEPSALNVELYNSVLWGDSVYPFTLQSPGGVRELYVGETAGFAASNNIVLGLPAQTWSGSTLCPVASGSFYRAAVKFGIEPQYATWDDFCASPHGSLCAGSFSTSPGLVDTSTVTPDLRVGVSNSNALEHAATGRTDWLKPDPRGFDPWDGPAGNGGTGPWPYADIGAYEDVEPGPITDLSAPAPSGSHSVVLVWTAAPDDRNAGSACEYTDIRYATSPVNTETAWQGATQVSGEPQPALPGTQQSYEVAGLNTCTQYYFAMKLGDKNGNYGPLSNMVTVATACGGGGCVPPPCIFPERPRGNGAVVWEDDAPFHLGLEGVTPNPSSGALTVSWSIADAQAGRAYELALFDVAGRRVLKIDSGIAAAGRFTQKVSFAGNGPALANGLFFLRLRVGNQVLKRTVVLTR